MILEYTLVAWAGICLLSGYVAHMLYTRNAYLKKLAERVAAVENTAKTYKQMLLGTDEELRSRLRNTVELMETQLKEVRASVPAAEQELIEVNTAIAEIDCQLDALLEGLKRSTSTFYEHLISITSPAEGPPADTPDTDPFEEIPTQFPHRYAVFVYELVEPRGGMNDLGQSFATLEEAEAYAKSLLNTPRPFSSEVVDIVDLLEVIKTGKATILEQ